MRFPTHTRQWMTISALVALLAAVFAAGYVLGGHAPARSAQAQGSQPTDTQQLFQPFWQAWDLLHDHYVDPLEDEVLLEGALTGMIDAAGDPFTMYMNPDFFERANSDLDSDFEGIGAVVSQNEETGGLTLISVLAGSPAELAGLRAGDEIVSIDGRDVTQLAQEDIIDQVRGPAGTMVQFGIRRPGVEDVLSVIVVRDRITSVSYKMLDDGIGYIQLRGFERSSTDTLREALIRLDANNLNGLVLDLRGNPGGYLDTTIAIASAFLEDGVVLIERGTGDSEIQRTALGSALAPDVPLVVLVNEGSASASEVLAGALQDRGRATVLGTTTYGKGSVQIWLPLLNGGGVRITISRWYTPNGNSVSERGIIPDIELPFDPEASGDPQLEAALEVLKGTFDTNNSGVAEGGAEAATGASRVSPPARSN